METLFHLLETILPIGTSEIITGVSEGSILGPLFFNIFINDLFLSGNNSQSCNSADDNTLNSGNKNISQIISDLSNDFETLTKWFYDNYMVLNPDKCHFMTLRFQDQNFDFSSTQYGGIETFYPLEYWNILPSGY